MTAWPGEKNGIAWALVHLGNLVYYQGDYAASRSHAQESLAVFRGLGHRMGIACSVHHLGTLAFVEGDLQEACRLHEEALRQVRVVRPVRHVARDR